MYMSTDPREKCPRGLSGSICTTLFRICSACWKSLVSCRNCKQTHGHVHCNTYEAHVHVHVLDYKYFSNNVRTCTCAIFNSTGTCKIMYMYSKTSVIQAVRDQRVSVTLKNSPCSISKLLHFLRLSDCMHLLWMSG